MNRVYPRDLLGMSPDEISKLQALNEKEEERKLITVFSLEVGVSLFETKMLSLVGKSAVFYLDGHLIQNESYLEDMTEELCREDGLHLLTVIADLILPVGFSYSSLLGSLSELVDSSFQPIEIVKQKKIIVWMEDNHWKKPDMSILNILMQQLYCSGSEPFLISPKKYFDKDVMAAFCRKLFDPIPEEGTASKSITPENYAQTFSIFVMFGFLLALRANLTCPLIVLHFEPNFVEAINAFQLVDLAKAEGHKIMFMKNTATRPSDRLAIVEDFVEKIQYDLNDVKH